MKIWTVANQKGGVGKTTTAVSLAGCLLKQGYRVLLVDTDPHASLTYYLQKDACETSLYDIFLAANGPCDYSKVLVKTGIKNLDLLPSNTDLTTLDRQFAQQSGKGLVLKKALASLDDQYDFAIIDCPPVLGVLMVNALVCAEQVIIPTQTEYLSLRGLASMLTSINILTPSMRDNVEINIVATMFNKRLLACQKAYRELIKHYSTQMWRGYIPMDTKFRHASEKGLPIHDLAAKSRGRFAYEKLCNDLLRFNRTKSRQIDIAARAHEAA